MPARIWAVLALAMGTSMAVLVAHLANVALPTIASDFSVTPAESVWVVNIYQLVVTVSLLPLAALGDVIGYRRIYLCGLLVFVVGSLLCAVSDSFAMLIFARAIQGAGGAGIMSVSSALTRSVYPGRLLGRGIGISAMVVAISAAAGPAIASVVLLVAEWPWVFAVLIPFGLGSLIMGWRALPMNPLSSKPFDIWGAVLNALTFGFFILGIEGIGHSQPAPIIVVELILAVVIGTVFVRSQMRESKPLLPLDLLKGPMFSLSVAAAFFSFMAQVLAMVTLPFYLQSVLGLSPVQAGLQLTAWPLAIVIFAPFSGLLADRYPAGMLGTLGLSISTLGLVALAFMPEGADTFAISWRLGMCGLGFALFQQPNTRVIIGSAPKERAGGASGMLATTRLSGQTTGAATAAIVFGMIASGGYTEALKVAMVIAIVATLISSARLLPTVSSSALSKI